MKPRKRLTLGKSSLLAAIFFLFLLSSVDNVFAKVVVDKGINTTTYHFTIDEVISREVVIDGKKFTNVRLSGVDGYDGIFFKKGHPEIPVVRFVVDAEREDDIRVSFKIAKTAESMVRSMDFDLAPSQESLPKIEGARVEFVKNVSLYKVSSFIPSENFTIEDAGSKRGVSQKMITIYPLKYNPFLKTFKVRKNFKVEVENFSNSLLKESASSKKKDAFAFIIGNKFKTAVSLHEYMKFKAGLGYVVIPIIVGEDVETTEDIRRKLQEIYHDEEYNLKYALVVGDIEDVPSHQAPHLKTGVTDHYYRAIDMSNYENDVNGPDIGVGRIPAKNEAELNLVIAKFVKYQRGVFSNEDWMDHVSFIATNDKWEIAEGTHNFVIEKYTVPAGYSGVFPNDPMIGGDKLYAITHSVSDEKVLNTMKLGRLIINYSGHGGTGSWVGPHITQDDVRSIAGEEVFPFVVSNACVTGQFIVDESFAETWIKHPAGAIMYWGSMDNTYWTEDDILEKAMYRGIYKDNLADFASITQNALAGLWQHYGGSGKSKYYWETYVTFGDPSIYLRTTRTRSVSIDGPVLVPHGQKTVSYLLRDFEGKPLKGGRLSLTKDDGTYIDSVVTDKAGKATVDLSSLQVGEGANISVYGRNIRMFRKKILVANPSFPYFSLVGIKVNGRETLDVFPAEEVRVSFSIKNLSNLPSNGGTLSIVELKGPAVVTDDNTVVPPIDGGQTLDLDGSKLGIKVKDSAVNGEVIELKLKWANEEGISAVITKRMRVIRGKLEVVMIDFGDPDMSEYGGFYPGTTGDIYLTIKNTGLAPIDAAEIDLENGSCINDTMGDIKIEKLLPGEIMRVSSPISVSLNETCENNDKARLNLRGSYPSGGISLDLSATAIFNIGKLGQVEFVSDNLSIPIMDRETIRHTVKVVGVDSLKDVSIHLKLLHTYIGDLTVTLTHRASGKKITLHDRGGGGTDDINRIYGVGGQALENVAELFGMNPEGEWDLEITDNAVGDQGNFNFFKFNIMGYLVK